MNTVNKDGTRAPCEASILMILNDRINTNSHSRNNHRGTFLHRRARSFHVPPQRWRCCRHGSYLRRVTSHESGFCARAVNTPGSGKRGHASKQRFGVQQRNACIILCPPSHTQTREPLVLYYRTFATAMSFVRVNFYNVHRNTFDFPRQYKDGFETITSGHASA